MTSKFFLKFFLVFILFNSFSLAARSSDIPNTVVTCTVSACPTIPPILGPNEKLTDQAIVYQTSNQPEFMTRYTKTFSATDDGSWHHIIINESALADTQPIIGLGGAFTDSAAMLYQHMVPALQKALIAAYFSPQGIAYSLGRVPIASSDFSCRNVVQGVPVPSLDACSAVFSPYSYADKPDATLGNFALQPEDLEYKIPMIQAAIQAALPNDFRLFASPWSAPAWMKTNGSMVHGALNPEFQQVWANYFVKFLEAYQRQQITFWGVTVQNEPEESGFLGMKDMQTWQTMYFTAEEQANFIKNYLGPTLTKFEKDYGSRIHLMMHDDQITSIHSRASMVSDPDVAQYVDGAGLHWYMNIAPYYSNLDKAYTTLNSVNRRDRFILATEACEGYLPTDSGPSLGSWSRGEAYAHDMISDMNHHVSGWTDWNLLLDTQGGPNWAKNYVDAPILFDVKKQIFYKQPMYYYLGHFSKFIRPDSRLLASQSQGPIPLEEVSFKVPAHDNLPETIVVVVLNRDLFGRNYYIQDENKYLTLHISAHAIQTVIYRAVSK